MEKTFKTLDEQIKILQDKGMVIDDINYTKDVLLRENYFFIMGYRHLFFKSEHDRRFITNTNFSEIYALFNFDRQIRNILFKNMLIVENNAKSIFSYQLSKQYGYKEKDYLNPNNFNKESGRKRQVNDLLKKMQRQIRINGGQHSATMHYISNYGYIPLWIVVKVLSFGIVSELFTILKPTDQEEIASIYNISSSDIGMYLPIVANYRNLCAHEDICYINRTQKAIDDTKYHRLLYIPKISEEYIYGKNDLFALIIILKQMLTKDEFMHMMDEINLKLQDLTWQIKSVKINKIYDTLGFPENYMDLINIE